MPFLLGFKLIKSKNLCLTSLLYRKEDSIISNMRNIVFDIMEAFVNSTTAIQTYLNNPDDNRAEAFRNNTGGSLLFRPIALTEYFNAAIVLFDNGYKNVEAFTKLNQLPHIISENPWNGLLWDGTKMVNRVSRSTVKSLLVYMVDKNLLSENEYKKMTELYAATLNIDVSVAQDLLSAFSGSNK